MADQTQMDVASISSQLVAPLRERLGENLEDMVLFGLRGRGNARSESGYDFLIVVKCLSSAIRDAALAIAAEIDLKHQIVVSVILKRRDEWERQQSWPLASNVTGGWSGGRGWHERFSSRSLAGDFG